MYYEYLIDKYYKQLRTKKLGGDRRDVIGCLLKKQTYLLSPNEKTFYFFG